MSLHAVPQMNRVISGVKIGPNPVRIGCLTEPGKPVRFSFKSMIFVRKVYALAGKGNRKKRMPLCNAEDRDFILIRKDADFR